MVDLHNAAAWRQRKIASHYAMKPILRCILTRNIKKQYFFRDPRRSGAKCHRKHLLQFWRGREFSVPKVNAQAQEFHFEMYSHKEH